jgi:hypothetical protein
MSGQEQAKPSKEQVEDLEPEEGSADVKGGKASGSRPGGSRGGVVSWE